jgi:hypothetical protein
MNQLFCFPSAVKRDPAIEVWLREHSDELGTIAQHWFDVMRLCDLTDGNTKEQRKYYDEQNGYEQKTYKHNNGFDMYMFESQHSGKKTLKGTHLREK